MNIFFDAILTVIPLVLIVVMVSFVMKRHSFEDFRKVQSQPKTPLAKEQLLTAIFFAAIGILNLVLATKGGATHSSVINHIAYGAFMMTLSGFMTALSLPKRLPERFTKNTSTIVKPKKNTTSLT